MTYKGCFTQAELDEFSSKPDIEVVFDIGAKDNVEYLEAKPNATFHLFEPRPESFEELKINVTKGGWKNVFVNNFGIVDVNGLLSYNVTSESFEGSKSNPNAGGGYTLEVRSGDWYVKEFKVEKIDFIKMDTEGMEYKIIKANPVMIGMTKYLQYEHWNNDDEIRSLLPDFTFKDLGNRNIFCTRIVCP